MILLKNIKNIFAIPELTRKLMVTLGIIIVYRIGTFIPVIGINVPLVAEHMQRLAGQGGLLSYLDTFSGGALSSATIFSLGIGPYITASIMMQMLSMAVPFLEQLAKEGDYGRKLINQYTRYVAVVLSIGYGLGYASYLQSQNLVLNPGLGFTLMFVLSVTTGALLVMWLGEQISLMGIGNGSSIIIFAGIVSRFPDLVLRAIHMVQTGNASSFEAIFILFIFVALAACIVFLEKGDRKIAVQYTRRVIGQRVYGGQSTYIPFKINPSGVLPAILSYSVLSVPIFIATMFADRSSFMRAVADSLHTTGVVYNVLEFVLIIVFTFFYTALLFNAQELSDQLKKSGGFIGGIRPGKQTADYFDYVLTRIAVIGALYLGTLAVLPNILTANLRIPLMLSGTSLLIVVGVALELAAQIESYLIEHKYEGFLSSGRIKSRVMR